MRDCIIVFVKRRKRKLMLTKEQLQVLADGEASKMFGPQLGRQLMPD